jgi:hypothetical protein
MDYEVTRSHHGDPKRILEAIRDPLAQLGFRVERQFTNGLALRGPGMYSSKQNVLLGMSQVEVRVTSYEISLRAELRGARSMKWLVVLLSYASIGVLVGRLQIDMPNRGVAFAAILLSALGFFIWPLTPPMFKKRTIEAIDSLLQKAVVHDAALLAETGMAYAGQSDSTERTT